MHLPVGFATSLRQCFQKTSSILIVLEYRFPPVAPVHEMVDRSRVLDSESRAPDIAVLFSRFPVIFCESEGGEGGPKPVRFFGRCFSMAGYGHYS